MTNLEIGIASFPVLMGLIFLRVPIGLAMLLVALGGLWAVTDGWTVALARLKHESFSTFSRKNWLHAAAHSVSDLQPSRRGSFSVFPRLSMESANLHAAACRLDASDIFFIAVCILSSCPGVQV